MHTLARFWDVFAEDKVMVGAAAGVLGTIAKDCFDLFFFLVKLLDHSCFQMAAGLFLPMDKIGVWSAIIAGILADLTIGATIGVFFIYFIRATGPRLILCKGIISGPFIWVAIYGALRCWHITSVPGDGPAEVLVFFFSHVIMGLAMGWFVERFGGRALRNSP